MDQTIRFRLNLGKRSGKDRRKKSGLNIRSFLLGGKRQQIRRQQDIGRIFYVDQYSPGLFFIIVSILFLCVLDALLTLFLLDHGAYELNPVMAYFLEFGPFVFFTSKYLLTITALICLLMFRNIAVRIIKIRTISVLYFMAAFYLVVVAMELYFIFTVPYIPDNNSRPKILTDSHTICRVDTPKNRPVLGRKNATRI